jgi:hypothetical protein
MLLLHTGVLVQCYNVRLVRSDESKKLVEASLAAYITSELMSTFEKDELGRNKVVTALYTAHHIMSEERYIRYVLYY